MQYLKNTFFSLLFIFILVSCGEKQPKGINGWWVIDTDHLKQAVEKKLKTATAEEQVSLKMIMPNITRLADKMTMVITDQEIIGYFGKKETKTPYKLKNVENGVYTIDVNGTEKQLVLEGNRIYDPKETVGKEIYNYMRRLSSSEIEARKKKLFEAKQPPNAKAKADERILFFVYHATPEQREKLLKEQKDLLTIKQSSGNETILFKAVEANKLDLVKTLVAAGASIKDLGYRNKNLLFPVVEQKTPNKAMFEYLVAQGVDISGINKDLENLLIKFCNSSQDLEFLKYLLSLKKFDINHKSKRKATALSETLKRGWLEGAELLLEHGAAIDSAKISLKDLARFGQFDSIKYLFDKGIILDSYNRTALFRAAHYYTDERVKDMFPKLLKLFKDYINQKDNGGNTAVFECQDLECLKLMVKAGADLFIKTESGHTLKDQFIENPKLLNFLKSNGQ